MPRWTPAARERQRQLINQVRPWEHSTGPNHGARAPGTHPRELRQYRARLWRLWKLRLSLVSLAGIFAPETTRSLADQIVSTEASLGIPRAETEARLTRSLLRLAQRRVSR
jgi:hypothetical protein